CTKMLLTEGGVVKGFDFGQKTVCSMFPSQEETERYLLRKEQAGAIYPTAKTLDVQKEKCFVTEELLTDDSTDVKTKFDEILRFCERKSANETYTQYSCPVFRSDEQVGRIFEKTLNNAGGTYGQLRTCIQHGDLWDGNVFLRNGTPAFIDFDKMKEHMCFYDMLLYIFTEAFINGDLTLMKEYLSGAYHGTMCAILKTDDSDVFDYETVFVIFLNEMFLDRFQSADHAFLMRVLDAVESWGIRLVRRDGNGGTAGEKEGVRA
ncbi:MAG: phosphotransferase, partial [Lachnospiraceae bacterium]|nr:phosphotransferase [Lachnospiraceae bacterium]